MTEKKKKKGDGRHYLDKKWQAASAQLERAFGPSAEKKEPSAEEIAEVVLRHLDPPRGEYPSRAAAALAALDAAEDNSGPSEFSDDAAFSRKVTGCKSCPFSDGVAGEWCRRYSRFNPPHELEAWGRPEWCEPGDIVVTIEETEVEDDLGDQRVNYTGGEKK